jgi:predicted aconitase
MPGDGDGARADEYPVDLGRWGNRELKTLGAAMAASGAVALYHIEGVTPEATTPGIAVAGAQTLVVDDLVPGYAALNGLEERVDLVSLGCPHASLAEIDQIASYLGGRRVNAALWITTARLTRDAAERAGLVGSIEAAGGRVVADTCMVVAPVAELGFRTLATNSAKMAFYTPSHSGLSVRFGTMEQCLEAAVVGKWQPSASVAE